MNEQRLAEVRRVLTQPVAAEFASFVVRIVTGVLLIWHGSTKLFDGFSGLVGGLTERGWPMPMIQAFAATYIEFAGGILLVVGLFTRPTALLVVGQFVIITFFFHAGDPFKVQEKALLFLLLGTYLFLVGPGKWSVDAKLFGPRAS